MGNAESKRAIDPNESKNQERQEILAGVSHAFKTCATNGSLTKDKFNQVLSLLEGKILRRMRDTPLAHGLFRVLCKSNKDLINEREFIQGINEIVLSQENAISYTLRAYDRDGDLLISRKEFLTFIEESWRVAFRLLFESLDPATVPLTAMDVEAWAKSKIPVLDDESSRIFNQYAKGSEKMDYNAFKQFLLYGNCPEIEVELDGNKYSIPLTLTNVRL